MGKDIDLTSREWRELIFEGKNQEYGAYYLRETSNKRHIRALIIITSLAVILALLPAIFKFVQDRLPKEEIVDTGVELTDVDINKPKEEDDKPPEIEIPQQEQQTQTAYVAPVITERPVAQEQQQIQEDLNEKPILVGIQDVKDGVDDAPIKDLDDVVKVAGPKKDSIYTYVDEPPTYPGGETARLKFLASKVVYPPVDLETGTQGVVYIQFTVSPSGKLTDFKVVRNVSQGLDAEALRVAKLMPDWNPGRKNGELVYVSFKMPVNFKLQTQN